MGEKEIREEMEEILVQFGDKWLEDWIKERLGGDALILPNGDVIENYGGVFIHADLKDYK